MAGKNVIATRDVPKDADQTTIINKYDAAQLANKLVGSITADLLKPVTPADESALAEVAEMIGYQSASAFSTAFTRHTGLAPSVFARGN